MNELSAFVKPTLRVGESLSDGIYLSMRDAICQGDVRPEFRLREVALAKHFEVSTTPIREAIRRLEREGLVKLEPRRGAAVAGFAWSEIVGLLEIRGLLGIAAVRKAALVSLPGDLLDDARRALADAEPAAQNGDRRAFATYDMHFHGAINLMSGNAAICQFDELAHRQLQRAVLAVAEPVPGRLRHSQQEHAQILDAIESGDPDAAEKAERLHLRATLVAMRRAYAPSSEFTADETAGLADVF